MLMRLHVQGFKNLLDVEVYFGPFTCIVGLNAVGKSNLFDAIRFLHPLTEKNSIMEAVQSLRDTHGRALQPADLFTKLKDYTAPKMRFVADLVVDRNVKDDFGVKATAAISTLRYEVAFDLNYMGSVQIADSRRRGLVAHPFVPPKSWRGQKTLGTSQVAPGSWAAYLGLPKDTQAWLDVYADKKVTVK